MIRSNSGRQVRPQLRRGRCRMVQDGDEGQRHRVALERRPRRGHLIEQHAEGKQVRAHVEIFAARLLRRHVRHRAHGGARTGEQSIEHRRGGLRRIAGAVAPHRTVRDLRQSEIHDLDLSARGDEDVGRLDVAVHHALGMRRIQRVRRLDGQIQQFVELERCTVDPFLESLAFQVLHHQERPALVAVDIVERADVRMVQRGDGARLALKALHCRPVRGHGLRQKLHRHRAPQARILGLINDAHAAATQHREDPVVRNRLTDHDSTQRCL